MPLRIAVLKETQPHERRVAMVPSVAGELTKLGTEVCMQAGAGLAADLPDNVFKNVRIVSDIGDLLPEADIVLSVQAPSLTSISLMKQGAILVCFVYAQQAPDLIASLRDRKITCFAMERIPRISRAQAMDALSSQAALSGYYAVLLGATRLNRILPRMTTAVGSLRPSTVLVMGLGVAGLQALATARRLGALLEGYDVRPQTKEEAESLGAKFVETGVNAQGEGGYARELTPEEKATVDRVLTRHIQKADLIITTASVPGRPAPKLITKRQVEGMKAGAVVVDLAAESGGNCEYAQPGKSIRVNQVTIIAPLNVPSLLSQHASELYAKNQSNLLKLMIHEGQLRLDWNDDILAKCVVTYAGEIKNGLVKTDSARTASPPAGQAAAPPNTQEPIQMN